MFFPPRKSLPIYSEIDSRLRALERNFRPAGGYAAAGTQFADHAGGALQGAFTHLMDRFGLSERMREGGHDINRLSMEAGRLSDQALRRVSSEVGRRPLATIAVAIGVGILVGLVSRGSVSK